MNSSLTNLPTFDESVQYFFFLSLSYDHKRKKIYPWPVVVVVVVILSDPAAFALSTILITSNQKVPVVAFLGVVHHSRRLH